MDQQAHDGGGGGPRVSTWVALFCAAGAAVLGVVFVSRHWAWIERTLLWRARDDRLRVAAAPRTPAADLSDERPSNRLTSYAKLVYIPHDEVPSGLRFIVVDGSPSATGQGEISNLTHSPGNKLPTQLRRDTSTEIAFVCQTKEKQRAEWVRDASHVTIDHIDLDGLLALFVFVEPESAIAHRSLLEKMAHLGDFTRIKPARERDLNSSAVALEDTTAIKCWLALEGLLASREVSELAHADKVRRMLQELPAVLRAPNKYASHWQAEYEFLQQCERHIHEGSIEIRDKAELDLTLVLVKRAVLEGLAAEARAALTERHGFRLAVHSRTKCFCTLVSVELGQQGSLEAASDTTASVSEWRHGLAYRYESYVEYVTALPHCRRDLTRLVARLNEAERRHAGASTADVWRYVKEFYLAYVEMASSTTVSRLSPHAVRTMLKAFLRCEDEIE